MTIPYLLFVVNGLLTHTFSLCQELSVRDIAVKKKGKISALIKLIFFQFYRDIIDIQLCVSLSLRCTT